jgi:DNA polymerase
MQTEQDACIGYLRAQTKLLHPKIIVCLGRIAAMKLIREDFRITRDHGQWTQKGGIWFSALYHPSALLRDESKRPDTFRDLKSLQAKVREVCTRTYE